MDNINDWTSHIHASPTVIADDRERVEIVDFKNICHKTPLISGHGISVIHSLWLLIVGLN